MELTRLVRAVVNWQVGSMKGRFKAAFGIDA